MIATSRRSERAPPSAKKQVTEQVRAAAAAASTTGATTSTTAQSVKTGKRGRPPIVYVSASEDGSGRGSDTDEDYRTLTQNRQKRLRTIDVSKDVLVLRPHDDVEVVLGLSSKEAEVCVRFPSI